MSAPAPHAAPGPYSWNAQAGITGNAFHCYLLDANGRKIGVVWGPLAEKGHTAALFAASHDLLLAAQAALNEGFNAADQLIAAIAKATSAPVLAPAPKVEAAE